MGKDFAVCKYPRPGNRSVFINWFGFVSSDSRIVLRHLNSGECRRGSENKPVGPTSKFEPQPLGRDNLLTCVCQDVRSALPAMGVVSSSRVTAALEAGDGVTPRGPDACRAVRADPQDV